MAQKKEHIIALLITVGIFCFGFSTVYSLVSINKLIFENEKDKSLVYANELSEKIDKIFSKPKSVALSIDNSFIYDYVKNPDNYSDEELDKNLKRYLKGLTERFGYETAYVASLANLKYYTEHGFSVYIDPDKTDSEWFMDFLNSNQEFEVKVDNDQANDDRITVYINVRMEEPNGNVIGACGIGIAIDDMAQVIKQLNLNNDYNVMIVSKIGKIQLANNIDYEKSKEYYWHDVTPALLEQIQTYDTSKSYKYVQKDKDSFYIIQYIDEFEWYLVMEYIGKATRKSTIVYKNLFVWGLCFAILLIIIYLYTKKYQIKLNDFKLKSEVDHLTGLLNRHSFEEKKQLIKQSELVYFCTIVIDIDSLKKVNDSIGHDAGDELIRGAARLIKNYFSPYGTAYRIGGDEFIIIINKPFVYPEEKIKSFKLLVSKWHGVFAKSLHVSVGFASGSAKNYDSIEELIKTADKEMYKDKRLYYKTIEKDRRTE